MDVMRRRLPRALPVMADRFMTANSASDRWRSFSFDQLLSFYEEVTESSTNYGGLLHDSNLSFKYMEIFQFQSAFVWKWLPRAFYHFWWIAS